MFAKNCYVKYSIKCNTTISISYIYLKVVNKYCGFAQLKYGSEEYIT